MCSRASGAQLLTTKIELNAITAIMDGGYRDDPARCNAFVILDYSDEG